VLQSGTGELAFTCPVAGPGTMSLRFRAISAFADYDLWVDNNGSISRQTVAAGTTFQVLSAATGFRHLFLRAIGGGKTGQMDLLLDPGSCRLVGVIDVIS
jgi:hypothetical protein